MTEDRRPDRDPDSAGPTHTSDGRDEPTTARRRVWGDLELLDEIGAGGYGRVYRAFDAALARDVALKVITIHDPSRADDLLREGQMLARVRHRHVVTVHAARRLGDEIGLVMELVDGQHLSDVVRQRGPMGAEEAALVGVRICQALAAVHAAGLVHRDVKARNVMREAGGRIVLMDFGTGRDLASPPADPDEMSGTPLYMAPELFAGGAASVTSDLYSVGVLLFFLTTGKYPVQERTPATLAIAHASGTRTLLSDVRPDLPVAFVRVVERALARVPDQRFGSAGAMMSALADTMSGGGTDLEESGSGVSARDELPPPRSRWPTWLLLGVVGVPLAVFFLGFAMSSAFNLTLGRTGGFSDDTAGAWWTYGVRSLVPVLVYAALTFIAAAALRAVWHLVRPGAARASRPADPARLAQGLLLLQGAALVAILWIFRDVWLGAIGFATIDNRASLAVLAESSNMPVYYRQALTAALVLSAIAWRRVFVLPGARQAVDVATRTGAIAIAVIMVFLLEMPYRLMFQADLPIVEHAGETCYELGTRPADAPSEILTYCPDWPPPRIRVVPGAEVSQTGRRGNLFGQ